MIVQQIFSCSRTAYLTAKAFLETKQLEAKHRELEEAAQLRDLDAAKNTEPHLPNGQDGQDDPAADIGAGEKVPKRRRQEEPECQKLFNEEGKAVSAHPGVIIGNLRDVLHSKQENWNKIGNRLQFRLFSLVKDSKSKLHDDFYYEESKNDSCVVHKACRVKIAWSHRGMVLKAVSIFKQFYLQIFPLECVMLEGFTRWAEERTRLFTPKGTAYFIEESIAYFFESMRKKAQLISLKKA